MLLLKYTKKKVSKVLEAIESLKSSDFPHEHSRNALLTLENVFIERLNKLEELKPTTTLSVVKWTCEETLGKVSYLLPLLGFILRSTNIRNAFELHGPLLRLTHQALGPDAAKLVISSEWDFSPFTYVRPMELEGFVMIGLPASESNNALVIPLAGHELGHNIWSAENLRGDLQDTVENKIKDIVTAQWADFSRQYPHVNSPDKLFDPPVFPISVIWAWVMAQCEEIFCDFIGLLIFRESYLHAFCYLLAPAVGGGWRAEFYPSMQDRVAALQVCANTNGITIPVDYANQFNDDLLPSDRQVAFLLSLSDAASRELVSELIDRAVAFATNKGLIQNSEEGVREILESFRLIVPASEPKSLSDIINAGWQAYLDEGNFWAQTYPELASDSKRAEEILNELVLKSVEVFEIKQLQK